MAYEKSVLHYMSGTGNTRRVATWFCDELAAVGTTVELHQIGDRQPVKTLSGSGSLLVLGTPTHAFTAPLTVLRFALNLPWGRGAHAAVFATRAGTKFGSLFLPGLEGTAVYILALILFLKGYRIRMAGAFDMPSNWLAVHPGFGRVSAEAIVLRAELRAKRAFGRVAHGGRRFFGFIPLLLGLLFSPISLAYLIMGRFFLAKLFFASDRCTSCGRCASKCPSNAIKMIKLGKLRPYWTFSCESCMRCMSVCPVRAVEVSQSFGVLLWIAMSVQISGLALAFFSNTFEWAIFLKGSIVAQAIQYLFMFATAFVLYRVLWIATQIRAINRFFTFTTLTHFWRRYIEPRTSIGELKGNHPADEPSDGGI